MKHAADTKTIELTLNDGKRGRGRPAKPDALTQAERAKRYRDAKRAAQPAAAIKRDVTETPVIVDSAEYMRLKRMYWSLEGQVALANAERDAAFKRNAELEAQVADLERDLQNSNVINMVESDCREEASDRLFALQRKFDLEHLARIEAETKLATLQSGAVKAKPNPLNAKVRGLTAEVKSQTELTAALKAENEQLRTSRK